MQIDHRHLQTLHRILIQLTDLNGQIDRCPRIEKAAQTAEAAAEQAAAELKATWTQTKKLADEKQLQLRQREARLNTLLGQRNACTNNREYQLLTDQMAADKQANAVLSDEILELLERLDGLEQEQKVAKQKVETAKAETARVRKEIAERIKRLQGEVQRVSGEFALEEKRLTPDVLAEFRRNYPKLGENTLAETEGETCGNCHQHFTINSLSKLRQSKLVLCQGCNAILYFSARIAAGSRSEPE